MTMVDPQSPETRLERFKMALCEGGLPEYALIAELNHRRRPIVRLRFGRPSHGTFHAILRARQMSGEPTQCLACSIARLGSKGARDADCLAYPTTDPTMLDCGADRA